MKKTLLLLVLWAATFQLFPQGIYFETTTWKVAVAKAKYLNKPIFLDIYTSWCQPCMALKTRVFSKPEVAKVYNEQFVCFSVDAEKGEGPDLAMDFDVHVYPTLLYLRPNGEVCAIHRGFMDVKTFNEFAKTTLISFQDTKTLSNYKKLYPKQKGDTAFMAAYLNKRRAMAEPNDALFDEYLKLLSGQDLFSDRVAELYNAELSDLTANSFACKNLLLNKAKYEGRITGNISNRLKDCAFRSASLAARNHDLTLLDDAILAYGDDPTPANFLHDYFYMQYYQTLNAKSKFVEYASRYFNDYLVGLEPSKQMNKGRIVVLLMDGSNYVLENVSDEKVLNDALRWSLRGLRLSPENPNCLYICGQLQYKLGQKEEGKKNLFAAINLLKDPNSETAKKYRETLRKMM